MTVWKLKGRNELTGYISGDMYLIEDKNISYYYLINILNPKDIRIINNPSRSTKKVLQLDVNDVPDELKVFHEMRMSLKAKKYSSEEISSKFQKEKEERELAGYFVHDLETTKYIVSKIGKVYHDVSLDFISSRSTVYILDNIWKVKIEKISPRNVKYSVVQIAEEKAEFGKKVKNLMNKTNMPWEICKLFVNDFPEDKAIIVLEQIKKDKIEFSNNVYALGCSSFYYFSSLCQRTDVMELSKLSFKKRQYLSEYVYNSIY